MPSLVQKRCEMMRVLLGAGQWLAADQEFELEKYKLMFHAQPSGENSDCRMTKASLAWNIDGAVLPSSALNRERLSCVDASHP